MTALLAPILVMLVVVGAHEAGHLAAARAVGIRVDVFSIGIGPALVRRYWRGLVIRLAWLPLGGFVRVDRAALAGAVLEVQRGNEGTMHTVGFPPDGRIESLGIMLTPAWMMDDPAEAQRTSAAPWPVAARNMAGAIAATTTATTALVTGPPSSDAMAEFTGPIGIGWMTARAAHAGFGDLLWIAGLISVGLGLFNLLPLPPFDGGRILLPAVEGLVGRPVPETLQLALSVVGLLVLLAVLAVATRNDLRWFFADT